MAENNNNSNSNNNNNNNTESVERRNSNGASGEQDTDRSLRAQAPLCAPRPEFACVRSSSLHPGRFCCVRGCVSLLTHSLSARFRLAICFLFIAALSLHHCPVAVHSFASIFTFYLSSSLSHPRTGRDCVSFPPIFLLRSLTTPTPRSLSRARIESEPDPNIEIPPRTSQITNTTDFPLSVARQ